MLKKIALLAPAILLAGRLLAGGFFLQLGNPDASPEARKLNAALTIKAAGCHDPATSRLTATAIGVVNGEHREVKLTVNRLSEPGMFAIKREWPREGKWVIRLEARNDAGQFTNSLVAAGPDGVDRSHMRENMQPFGPSDIDAMLK